MTERARRPTRQTSPRPEQFVDVGRIVGAFGLLGAVKVQLLTDFPERFDPGKHVWLRGEPLEILETHWHKGQGRVRLQGVTTVEDAEALVGEVLRFPAAKRPKLGRGEFYHDQLLGLGVVLADGSPLGVVEEVLPSPANDLLRVGDTLIPVVKQFVLKVDLKSRRITVRLIPGMGPGEEAEEVG